MYYQIVLKDFKIRRLKLSIVDIWLKYFRHHMMSSFNVSTSWFLMMMMIIWNPNILDYEKSADDIKEWYLGELCKPIDVFENRLDVYLFVTVYSF